MGRLSGSLCNTVLASQSEQSISLWISCVCFPLNQINKSPLPFIQNPATCLVFNQTKCCHINPLLRSLWCLLPVAGLQSQTWISVPPGSNQTPHSTTQLQSLDEDRVSSLYSLPNGVTIFHCLSEF